jgi:prolyl-tRNA editing enzyme YbaK/EbsC (Cys-tRNA(Pro) deacylase)
MDGLCLRGQPPARAFAQLFARRARLARDQATHSLRLARGLHDGCNSRGTLCRRPGSQTTSFWHNTQMGIIEARAHLKQFGKDNDIIEFDESSATVALAAKALGTDECRIAKSLSFRVADHAIIVVTAGDMRIDNRRFKDVFQTKAVMPTPQEVEALIGHGVGGVCPFGMRAGVDVYLDVSLRQYDYVYPACGSANSAIRLTCEELERFSGARQWVDVCKGRTP